MPTTSRLLRILELVAAAVLLVLVVEQFQHRGRTSRSILVSTAVWTPAIATLWLTPRALFTGSWLMMWVAALSSYVFSIISMFSIGALVFALTCIQIGAVAGMKISPLPRHWLQGMLAGALVWVLVVPVQLAGFVWLWGFGIYQVVGVVGLVLAPVADRARSFAQERTTS